MCAESLTRTHTHTHTHARTSTQTPTHFFYKPTYTGNERKISELTKDLTEGMASRKLDEGESGHLTAEVARLKDDLATAKKALESKNSEVCARVCVSVCVCLCLCMYRHS